MFMRIIKKKQINTLRGRNFIHSFIHSEFVLRRIHCLLQKRVLHRVRSSASSFTFHCPLLSLRSSTSCLHLPHCLLVTCVPPSVVPSVRKMWPIQLAFLLFGVCRMFLSSLTVRNTSSFFTQSVQLCSPSFPSTTFQNFPGISHLLSEMSKFQHHTVLCTKCSTCLVSSLNLIQFSCEKSYSCWMLLLPWQFCI